MSYTTLRVIDEGVLLYEWHAMRFATAGTDALRAFQEFAVSATPGIFALRWADGLLHIQERSASRLRDGLPIRYVPTPLRSSERHLPKGPSPNRYDEVRREGVATLLTSMDGVEIYESCTAAVISWRESNFVLVPSDRPRVWSSTEAWLGQAAPCVEASLRVDSTEPIALVNAVKGLCEVDAPGREPFPVLARETFRTLFRSSARRR